MCQIFGGNVERRIRHDKETGYDTGEWRLRAVRGKMLRYIDQQLMDGVAWWGWCGGRATSAFR